MSQTERAKSRHRKHAWHGMAWGPRVCRLAPRVVLLDLVGEVDREEVRVHLRVRLGHLLPGFILGGVDVCLVPLLDAVKQGTVARLATPSGVIKVSIVARLGADVTLHVAAAATGAGHLVAAILLDEGRAACSRLAEK